VGRSIATAGVLALLALAGCGDDGDSTGPTVVPAAGENTPMQTPGVPAGAAYDVSGSEWLELGSDERAAAADEFVADNPDACGEGGAPDTAETVRDFADATLGTDYPLNAPVAELLAEGCAAAMQSGEQDTAAG